MIHVTGHVIGVWVLGGHWPRRGGRVVSVMVCGGRGLCCSLVVVDGDVQAQRFQRPGLDGRGLVRVLVVVMVLVW